MEKENIIWTVPEVAKYLGCNVSSIRNFVINGTNGRKTITNNLYIFSCAL